MKRDDASAAVTVLTSQRSVNRDFSYARQPSRLLRTHAVHKRRTGASSPTKLIALANHRRTVNRLERRFTKRAPTAPHNLSDMQRNRRARLTIGEVAERLGVSNDTIRRRVLAGMMLAAAHDVASVHDLLGQTDEFLDAQRAPTWRANDRRARDGLFEVEETSAAAGGEQLYESMKFPLTDDNGRVYATCGVSLDVTERREFVRAAERARDAALESASAQRHIAASAAHELRLPTSAIIGYLDEVLDSNDLTNQDRELLSVAHRNARRMTELIDDLLVLADSGRTEQAIANVVSNALKFTPAGGSVRLAMHVGETMDLGNIEGSADIVELSVVDTAVGIEPASAAAVARAPRS